MKEYQLIREGLVYTVVTGHWLPKRLGHDAVTFAGTIRCKDDVLVPDLHCHEFQHIRQEQMMGSLMFWVSYLWNLRHGYHKNKYEIEAYAIQARPEVVSTFLSVPTP